MPTNDLQINLYDKKLLSLTGVSTYLLDYLSDKIDERTSAIFQQTSGVLDSDEIEIDASGNDEFDLNITNASRCVVGTGEIIDLSLLNGTGITTDIPVENANTVTYYVGIKYMQIADGIELNARTGDPEYPALRDSYGELDNPTSLSDTFGVQLTININSITESGVDHSGRTVKVYLVDPVSAVESTAFYEGTSVYNAPNNEVVITYSGSAGPLGQDTSVDPPSTTAADYIVAIEGATWRRNTDLRTDSDYAFIGTLTGAGAGNPIGATDLSDQNPIFINTLDRAYDGATGSGSGRLMFVDNEAIELRSRTGNTDEHRAILRLDQKGSSLANTYGIQVITPGSTTGTDGGNGITVFHPMSHSTAPLSISEAASTTGTRGINFTGSPDLVAANVRAGLDFAWLQGFSTVDGLYQIFSVVGSTTLNLSDLDGNIPSSWPSESGTVTLLRVEFSAAENAAGGGHDGQRGIKMVGNEEIGGNVLTIYGEQHTTALQIYKDKATTNRSLDWRSEGYGILDDAGLSITPDPLGAPDKFALNITPHSLVQLNNDLPSHRQMALWNENGDEIQRWGMWGYGADCSRYRQDFFVSQTPSDITETISGGGGTVYYNNSGFATNSQGGTAYVATGVTAGNTAQVRGPYAFALDDTITPIQRVTYMRARLRIIGSLTDNLVECGLVRASSGASVAFKFDATFNANWYVESLDGVGGNSNTTTSLAATVGQQNDDNGWIEFVMKLDLASNQIQWWITGRTSINAMNFVNTNNWNDNRSAPYFYVESRAAGAGGSKAADLDYWEVWDETIKAAGPAG